MTKQASEQSLRDTRERILDAAEKLFMQHGYDGTSMRVVTSEAGVNLAAANYHFGSKEALMQAVLRRRLEVINQERLRLLDEAEAKAAGKPLKPSVIIDCYFGTLLRVAADQKAGGETFLRLLGRTFTEPSDFIRAFMSTEYADVLERYKQALFRSLPDVPKAEIVWRFHFMLGATSYAIAGTDALHLVTDWQVEEGSADQDNNLLPRLMSFLIGGLRAPLPQSESGAEPAAGKPANKDVAA
jgi:AcrR family transcriptional regulator